MTRKAEIKVLKIYVLIKQVPNTTKVQLDPKTNNLIRNSVESVINPFDSSALELALSLKDRFGGEITLISMGPDQAADMMRFALAAGADSAYLLSDRAFAGADTLATSYTLAGAIESLGVPDLIICGKQAIDGDTAQVPAEIAVHLGIGCITNVISVEKISDKTLVALKSSDYGCQKMEMTLPGVITVEKSAGTLRLPTITQLLEAEEKTFEIKTNDDLQLPAENISILGSPTRVVCVFPPQKNERLTKELKGTADKIAAELLSILESVGGENNG